MKKEKTRSGLVFSTDPDWLKKLQAEEAEIEENENPSLPPQQQKLRVSLDRKQRGGKEVTLVTGFQGKTTDAEALGKLLKTKCGVGGSVKENEILVQGDHRKRVIELLLGMGYTQTKQSG